MVELCLAALDAADALPHCYVAARIGDSQKLGRFCTQRHYKFPQSVIGEHKYAYLDVFQRVGGGMVSLDTVQGEVITIPINAGGDVRFRVDLVLGDAAKKPVEDDKRKRSKTSGENTKREKLKAARDYVAKHNLQARLKDAMQAVMETLPEEPEAFIAKQLSETAVKCVAFASPLADDKPPVAQMPAEALAADKPPVAQMPVEALAADKPPVAQMPAEGSLPEVGTGQPVATEADAVAPSDRRRQAQLLSPQAAEEHHAAEALRLQARQVLLRTVNDGLLDKAVEAIKHQNIEELRLRARELLKDAHFDGRLSQAVADGRLADADAPGTLAQQRFPCSCDGADSSHAQPKSAEIHEAAPLQSYDQANFGSANLGEGLGQELFAVRSQQFEQAKQDMAINEVTEAACLPEATAQGPGPALSFMHFVDYYKAHMLPSDAVSCFAQQNFGKQVVREVAENKKAVQVAQDVAPEREARVKESVVEPFASYYSAHFKSADLVECLARDLFQRAAQERQDVVDLLDTVSQVTDTLKTEIQQLDEQAPCIKNMPDLPEEELGIINDSLKNEVAVHVSAAVSRVTDDFKKQMEKQEQQTAQISSQVDDLMSVVKSLKSRMDTTS